MSTVNFFPASFVAEIYWESMGKLKIIKHQVSFCEKVSK